MLQLSKLPVVEKLWKIKNQMYQFAENTGFSFTETMRGEYHFVGKDGKHRFWIELEGVAPSILRFFAPVEREPQARMVNLNGKFYAEGWVDGAEMENATLRIDPFGEKRLRYHFLFRDSDGKRYRFVGTKRVSFVSPWRSMTTLYVEIIPIEGTEPVARGTMYFDAAQLLPFIASFRLKRQ